MNPIFAPWMAEVVILSARSVKRDRRPPLPSEFVATFVVFGAMSLVANRSTKVASAFSWGIVVATLLNAFDLDGKLRLRPKDETPNNSRRVVSQTDTGLPINTGTGGPAGTITTITPGPNGGIINSRA